MAKKTTSASKKGHYAAYETQDRAVKNRIIKLKRHCKKFPNDDQAAKALKNSDSFKYRRNNIGQWKVWSSQKRFYGQLWAMFGENGHDVLAKGFLDNHSFKQFKDS